MPGVRLFNQSPLQLRLIGAHGGRAFGRNQRRARRTPLPTPPAAVPPRVLLRETTAESLTSVAAFHYLVAGCPDYRGRSDPAGEFVNLIASRAERPVPHQKLRREENGEGSIRLRTTDGGKPKAPEGFAAAVVFR